VNRREPTCHFSTCNVLGRCGSHPRGRAGSDSRGSSTRGPPVPKTVSMHHTAVYSGVIHPLSALLKIFSPFEARHKKYKPSLETRLSPCPTGQLPTARERVVGRPFRKPARKKSGRTLHFSSTAIHHRIFLAFRVNSEALPRHALNRLKLANGACIVQPLRRASNLPLASQSLCIGDSTPTRCEAKIGDLHSL
jgi:hypothetical protein